MAIEFKKATKQLKKWRILLRGTSGSGKTHSALVIANELKGKGRIVVADTEKQSSLHLADKFDFDVVDYNELSNNNHTPKGYIKLIDEVIASGKHTVLIIDSFSHSWIGQGGILQIVENLTNTKYSGNSYRAWSEGNAMYQELIDKVMFGNDLHIILTGRTKQAYELTGGKVIKKGMELQHRDGSDYEYDTVLDFDNSKPGFALPEKDRTGIFPAEGEMVTAATGKKMLKYIS